MYYVNYLQYNRMLTERSVLYFGRDQRGPKSLYFYRIRITPNIASVCLQIPYYCMMTSIVTVADNLAVTCFTAYAVSGGTPEGRPYRDEMNMAQEEWEAWRKSGKHVIPQAPTGWDPRPR